MTQRTTQVGSVVVGLTMSDVRQCLSKIRSAWDEATPWKPFCPSRSVFRDTSMEKFAWQFVAGHHIHRKRGGGPP